MGVRCQVSREKLADQGIRVHFKVSRDLTKDTMQRAHAEFLVRGDGDVVFSSLNCGGQAHVASALAGDLATVGAKERCKSLSVEIAWKLQAGMTSSLTR